MDSIEFAGCGYARTPEMGTTKDTKDTKLEKVETLR
jgi:hypothetical protein